MPLSHSGATERRTHTYTHIPVLNKALAGYRTRFFMSTVVLCLEILLHAGPRRRVKVVGLRNGPGCGMVCAA